MNNKKTFKYGFIGDAYLLGIKLNTKPINIEIEKSLKDMVSIDKAFHNTLFAIKKSFKAYQNYLDQVKVDSFVILDGDFFYKDTKYDAFTLQIPTTIEKMADKVDDTTYKFRTVPSKVEQLYFMKVINNETFTVKEYKNAFMTDHKLGLFYNESMVPYISYYVDKQRGTLINERYPNRYFTYDIDNHYYKCFDNILQVKEIDDKLYNKIFPKL